MGKAFAAFDLEIGKHSSPAVCVRAVQVLWLTKKNASPNLLGEALIASDDVHEAKVLVSVWGACLPASPTPAL
jgi:hypothetical protein